MRKITGVNQRLLQYGILALTLLLPLASSRAENLIITRLKSLIPAGDALSCKVANDEINLELNLVKEQWTGHVSFCYSYDFHFDPDQFSWLVKEQVAGSESVVINADLAYEENNQGPVIILRNSTNAPFNVKGKVKKPGDTDFFYYERPARIDMEIRYSRLENKALVNLSIRWLDEIPGYGVYDSDGESGIVEKMEGLVSPSIFPPPFRMSNLTNQEFRKPLLPSKKDSEDSNKLALPDPVEP